MIRSQASQARSRPKIHRRLHSCAHQVEVGVM